MSTSRRLRTPPPSWVTAPWACPLDVTSRASFAAFVDATEEQLGPLDVLVNNAGIMPLGRFVDEDDSTTQRMIDINLHGVIFGMKLALARMVPRDRGHIVNIASQAGKFGAPGGATYSATKHAVVGLDGGGARRAAPDGRQHRPQLRDAVCRQHRTRAAGWGRRAASSNLEPAEVADAIVRRPPARDRRSVGAEVRPSRT